MSAEDIAARLGAPILAYGQHWQVWEERGRLIFQDENGLLDLPLPNLPGPHQIQNAGAALMALRHLGKDEAAYTLAFVTLAEGVTLMTNLVDCDPSQVAIGQAVRVVFKPSEGGHAVPMFTLA